MDMPKAMFLFYSCEDFEKARDFCFISLFDFMDDLVGGLDALLLFNSVEIQTFCTYLIQNNINVKKFIPTE